MSHQKPNLKQIKLEAKLLGKEKGLQHMQALEAVSKKYGYQSWYQAEKELSKAQQPQYPFRFVMDAKDAGENWGEGFIDDDDLFDEWFARGLEKGLTAEEVTEILADIAFIRHETATPKTPEEAWKIINAAFFFPPISIWLADIEYNQAIDPATGKVLWKGYPFETIFDEEELDDFGIINPDNLIEAFSVYVTDINPSKLNSYNWAYFEKNELYVGVSGRLVHTLDCVNLETRELAEQYKDAIKAKRIKAGDREFDAEVVSISSYSPKFSESVRRDSEIIREKLKKWGYPTPENINIDDSGWVIRVQHEDQKQSFYLVTMGKNGVIKLHTNKEMAKIYKREPFVQKALGQINKNPKLRAFAITNNSKDVLMRETTQ